jgi:hypothetical protein
MIAVAVPSERWKPRVFVRVGSTPTLAIWQSVCVICRARFEVMTPIDATVEAPAFEIFTCWEHRGMALNWKLASVVICSACDAHHIEGMKHVCDPDALKSKKAKRA